MLTGRVEMETNEGVFLALKDRCVCTVVCWCEIDCLTVVNHIEFRAKFWEIELQFLRLCDSPIRGDVYWGLILPISA